MHRIPARIPARIAVRLGTVYSSNKGTFIHKMQDFWEHLQHATTIYKVKVNANKMTFYGGMKYPRVQAYLNLAGLIQLMLIYILEQKGSCVIELYIASSFLLSKEK